MCWRLKRGGCRCASPAARKRWRAPWRKASMWSARRRNLYERKRMSGSNVHIENEDCRVGIKRLDDNSVSLILTDPPYFLDGMGADWDAAKLKRRVKKRGRRLLAGGNEVFGAAGA